MHNATQKKHSDKAGEQPAGYKGLALIILLCLLGSMPLLIWISIPETSTYSTVPTSSAMVQSATGAAGLQICSQDTMSVEVPGVQSAIQYKIAPDCNNSTEENAIMTFIIGFDSTKTQMSAIADAQETVGNWHITNTTAFMTGTNVIVVYGAPWNQEVEQISLSLINQGAARIF